MSSGPLVGFNRADRFARCEACGTAIKGCSVRINLPFGIGDPEGGFLLDICARCAERLRRALGIVVGAHNLSHRVGDMLRHDGAIVTREIQS